MLLPLGKEVAFVRNHRNYMVFAIEGHEYEQGAVEAGDSIASTLAYTEQHLSWGYRKVFDRLDRIWRRRRFRVD